MKSISTSPATTDDPPAPRSPLLYATFADPPSPVGGADEGILVGGIVEGLVGIFVEIEVVVVLAVMVAVATPDVWAPLVAVAELVTVPELKSEAVIV